MAKKRGTGTKRERQQQQRIAQYRDDVRLLRNYYTGYDSRNGYKLTKPTKSARISIARQHRKIAALRMAGNIPHATVFKDRASKRTFKAAENYAPTPTKFTTQITKRVKRGRRTYTRKIKSTHQLKAVPIFTYDPRAKISSTKTGGLKIVEDGNIREVYPFNAEKLVSNPDAVYKEVRQFMAKHHATAIRFNLGTNIINVVYRRDDFNPKNSTASFVNMVNRYRISGRIGRFDNFTDAIRGISIVRGGQRAAVKSTDEIDALRKAYRERKKMTKRALMTGRQ